MNALGKVVAYALIVSVLGMLLRELGFRGSRLVTILGTVSLVGAAVVGLDGVISLLPGLSAADEYAVAILKIIGLGYASGICADVCAELGEGTLANAVSLFGKVEILLVTAPFIIRIAENGMELM